MRFTACLFLLPLLGACDDGAKVCRDTLELLKGEMAKNPKGGPSFVFDKSALKAERINGGTNCLVEGTMPNNPFGMRFAWRINPDGRFMLLGFEPFMR